MSSKQHQCTRNMTACPVWRPRRVNWLRARLPARDGDQITAATDIPAASAALPRPTLGPLALSENSHSSERAVFLKIFI